MQKWHIARTFSHCWIVQVMSAPLLLEEKKICFQPVWLWVFWQEKPATVEARLLFPNSCLDHKIKRTEKRRWGPRIMHMDPQNSLNGFPAKRAKNTWNSNTGGLRGLDSAETCPCGAHFPFWLFCGREQTLNWRTGIMSYMNNWNHELFQVAIETPGIGIMGDKNTSEYEYCCFVKFLRVTWKKSIINQ